MQKPQQQPVQCRVPLPPARLRRAGAGTPRTRSRARGGRVQGCGEAGGWAARRSGPRRTPPGKERRALSAGRSRGTLRHRARLPAPALLCPGAGVRAPHPHRPGHPAGHPRQRRPPSQRGPQELSSGRPRAGPPPCGIRLAHRGVPDSARPCPLPARTLRPSFPGGKVKVARRRGSRRPGHPALKGAQRPTRASPRACVAKSTYERERGVPAAAEAAPAGPRAAPPAPAPASRRSSATSARALRGVALLRGAGRAPSAPVTRTGEEERRCRTPAEGAPRSCAPGPLRAGTQPRGAWPPRSGRAAGLSAVR
ncbi:uncharacterized protein C10orf95-like [Equus przewalskii]|uniref:Uncharacterized protein C10orf95-like n=1 Tax=Equus przewalskii TaxID=9798 RepID=A0ABM4KD33_EQUPR